MPFEMPITIKEVIDNINAKKYLLPAIQREFVWDTDQIVRLFDSLMRDYPIGSFLYWYVDKRRINDYQYYEFVREYHEIDNKHNPKANVSGENDIIAILDGQQRFTALYVGLKGSYAYKLPYRKRDDRTAFPKRKLYLNLLQKASGDEIDMEYDFRFLTDKEAEQSNDSAYWFEVGKILTMREEHEVNEYLIENEIMGKDKNKSKYANKTLFKLHAVIHKDKTIHYFLEKDEKLDKVLNIFIRVNSGGTPLSYSDLLLSIATAQWKHKDAREEITEFVEDINSTGDGFKFDKDFVLKSCLVMCDFADIAFKVDNFNKSNMQTIEKKWDDIAEAIRLAVNLIHSYGYNQFTLTSHNALIPISYYLLKKGLPKNIVLSSSHVTDRRNIKKWLICSLLKRSFGGQPDNVLRPVRQIILENNGVFPFEKIMDNFKGGTKSIIFNDDEIDNLFHYRSNQSYTFSTLALLYPTLDFKNKFHIDHIYPKAFFTKKKLTKNGVPHDKQDFYFDNFNYLANLQLLEGIPNQEKSDMDFKTWLETQYPELADRKDFMNKHYIPDIDLSFDNFEDFIEGRKELMFDAYKSILK